MIIEGTLKKVRGINKSILPDEVEGVMFDLPMVGLGVTLTHAVGEEFHQIRTSRVVAQKVIEGVGVVFKTRNSFYVFTFKK